MSLPFPFSAIVGQDEMKLAVLVAAVEPAIGGVLVLGDRGTGKSTAVRALAALLPPMRAVEGCPYHCDPAQRCGHCAPGARSVLLPVPVVDLPLGASEDRIVGALDLERALSSGQKVFEPGLLARAHRGFLYIDEVNLLEDHLVDLLIDVAASGENVVEREGLSVRHPARFVLIGSGNPEEGELRPQLLDRFGLSVEVRTPDDLLQRVEVVKRRDAYERDPEAFHAQWAKADAKVRKQIRQARDRLPGVVVDDTLLLRCAELCQRLGSDGLRGELTLMRAARAMAALQGEDAVRDVHLRQVAAPALRHRLRRNPLDDTGSAERIARAVGRTVGMNLPGAWAARLLALDPAGLGGLVLRGGPGPARDALVAGMQSLLAPGTPWRRCPPQIDDARLLGGLDLGLSVAAGRPVAQAGLLAEVRAGVLVLPMAERAPMALAGRLAQALDAGGFPLVALDEGATPDERVATCLGERLALVVDPALAAASEWPSAPSADHLDAARKRLGELPFDADAVEALCACARALGIVGLRAPWQAWRAARAVAAWRGHAAVTEEDAELAARLVLAPRARSLPPAADGRDAEPPPAESPAAEPPSTESAPGEAPDDPRDTTAPAMPPPASAPAEASLATPLPAPDDPQDPLADRLVAAAQAAIPPGLLALLAAGLAPQRGTAAGRQGEATRIAASGRPLPARRGAPRGAQRLDLLATLRAALPWQLLRRQERVRLALPPSPARWLIRRDDFHSRRYRRPAETTTVFVVDASGSQALNRLAEAKGAVELLLADCYVRRDRVALIAFRGTGADLLLPPTRSLVRAKRALTELPGGGGTPLAAGIEAGWQLASGLQAREGARAQLVFLTDGRANIDRQGQGGRPAAMADAQAMARRLGTAGISSLLIDTSVRPQPESAALARQMGARYLALPQGRAALLHRAIAAAL